MDPGNPCGRHANILTPPPPPYPDGRRNHRRPSALLAQPVVFAQEPSGELAQQNRFSRSPMDAPVNHCEGFPKRVADQVNGGFRGSPSQQPTQCRTAESTAAECCHVSADRDCAAGRVVRWEEHAHEPVNTSISRLSSCRACRTRCRRAWRGLDGHGPGHRSTGRGRAHSAEWIGQGYQGADGTLDLPGGPYLLSVRQAVVDGDAQFAMPEGGVNQLGIIGNGQGFVGSGSDGTLNVTGTSGQTTVFIMTLATVSEGIGTPVAGMGTPEPNAAATP